MYPWGDGPLTCEYLVFREGGAGCGTNQTAPVCSTSSSLTPRQTYIPNGDSEQGVCDLNGNVREWTLDIYARNYRQISRQGKPWWGAATLEEIFVSPISVLRVTRGGAWVEPARYMNNQYRRPFHKTFKNYMIGMRLVASLCGNGDIDPGEECDDGNHNEYDGCDFLCQEN